MGTRDCRGTKEGRVEGRAKVAVVGSHLQVVSVGLWGIRTKSSLRGYSMLQTRQYVLRGMDQTFWS